MGSTEVTVGTRRLSLSNLEKVLYPAAGFSKGEVLDYYARISPWLLPHLRDRPLTLKRYPNGVEGPSFYEKRCPSHRPAWVKTFTVHQRHQAPIPFTLANDLPTLIWVANLASIELHPSLSKVPQLDRPTMVVFDLDPGAPAGALECCEVALRVRELLRDLGLESVVKTSGSKGLQVYAALNTPASYGETKPFARAVAELLEREWPQRVVSRMAKSLRVGKVLVDWSQNDPQKTTVCVYSLRARERPTVSGPVTWAEVARAVERRDARPLFFEAKEAVERCRRMGDLFEPLLTSRQHLPGRASSAAHGRRA